MNPMDLQIDPQEYAAHIMKHGAQGAIVKWRSTITIPKIELDYFLKHARLEDIIQGWNAVLNPLTGAIELGMKPNLVVNTGINMGLDRLFAINGPPVAVTKLGVDAADSTAVDPTATTSSSGANKKTIILFDATPTRTNQIASATGTFSQATVNFIMKRLFLSATAATLTNSATADDANSLYAMTNRFTIDLTPFTTWQQTFTGTVTGTGS
jgi:hypothetical protein